MTDDNDDRLMDELGRQLRAAEDDVDELTRARLAAARKQALGTVDRDRPAAWPGWAAGGFATAVVLVLAVTLWTGEETALPAMHGDDWELLAEGELQLIEDLDFYEWLPEEETAG